jgi:hypothetical protein
MEGQPLLGVLRGLILDDGAQAEFTADPSGYMQRAGYDDISEDDLGEAVSLVADTLPPDVAHAVTTAAAPPEGADGADAGDGGLAMLGRLAEIDADGVTPLEVPEPVDDYSPDDGLGWQVEDDSGGSFGDVNQDFDDFDAFADEAAEPEFHEGDQVPLSEAHNVDDDPVDIEVDVDVNAGHGPDADPDPEAELGFGEGSNAPDVHDDAPDTAAEPAEPAEAAHDDNLVDAFGSDASFDEGGDTSDIDDPAATLDGDDDPYGEADGYEGDAGDPGADDIDHVDDRGEHPDAGGDDIGFF